MIPNVLCDISFPTSLCKQARNPIDSDDHRAIIDPLSQPPDFSPLLNILSSPSPIFGPFLNPLVSVPHRGRQSAAPHVG